MDKPFEIATANASIDSPRASVNIVKIDMRVAPLCFVMLNNKCTYRSIIIPIDTSIVKDLWDVEWSINPLKNGLKIMVVLIIPYCYNKEIILGRNYYECNYEEPAATRNDPTHD